MNFNPIIIIDDDDDDLELIRESLAELKLENEIIVFNDAMKFLTFVKKIPSSVFFILCDINMSPVNGLELKQLTYEDEEVRRRCIPFVFLSNSGDLNTVTKAFSFGVHGYFVKPSSAQGLKDMLLSIVNYWNQSQHPNI
jgi:CheY-like chemotaxis protein